MEHELDAALNSLLVALTDSIVDASYDLLHLLGTDGDYGIDQSVMSFFLPDVHLLLVMSEDRFFVSLHNYGVDHLFNKLYVRVNDLLNHGLLLELVLSTFEESLLFTSHFFSPSSFSFLHSGLVFSKFNSWAFSAPSLSLLCTEVYGPLMTSLACDSDHCLAYHVSSPSNHLDLVPSTLFALYLAIYSTDNFHTVVAESMLGVGELPEGNLASMAPLLSCHILLTASSRLICTSLGNCVEYNPFLSRSILLSKNIWFIASALCLFVSGHNLGRCSGGPAIRVTCASLIDSWSLRGCGQEREVIASLIRVSSSVHDACEEVVIRIIFVFIVLLTLIVLLLWWGLMSMWMALMGMLAISTWSPLLSISLHVPLPIIIFDKIVEVGLMLTG